MAEVLDNPLSVVTLAVARKYTDDAVKSAEQMAIDTAVAEAVAQSNFYTDQQVSKILSFDIEIVNTLPDNPNTHTIYLVPKNPQVENNGYFEYIYTKNGRWELIGDTEIDLSDYYTKEEVEDLIKSNQYVLPAATISTLGGIKPDGYTIQVDDDGVASIKEEGASDIINDVIQPIGDDDISSLFN